MFYRTGEPMMTVLRRSAVVKLRVRPWVFSCCVRVLISTKTVRQ